MSSFTKERQAADNPSGTAPWRICCIGPNRSITDELTPALIHSFPGASVRDLRCYPLKPALEQEFKAQLPDLCFLDVISDPARALSLIPEILQVDSRISVVVLLAADAPDLILKCLRLGAAEFLIQPFGADQLQSALPKLARPESERAGQGKVYCVIPAKGACGASTVACSLAFQWKRSGSKRILLADMDPLTGTLSFVLKQKSVYSFIDVLNRADTLDADLWRALVTSRNGVDILLAPELLVHGIHDVLDATPVLEFARKTYDIVILDAGSAYGGWHLSQARGSDEILLVTTNELPALHGAQRSLSYLEANGVPRWRCRVIVNRYEKKIGLDEEAIASALHTGVLHTIPSDYELTQRSLLDGTPIPHNSGLGKIIAALADKLAGGEKEPAARPAPFGGLLSLFSRT